MKIIKLALISLVCFYLMIWAITLAFPNVTIMSRVISISGKKERLSNLMNTNNISYHEWLINNDSVDIRTSDISFYDQQLFNGEGQANADTIYFEMLHEKKAFLTGGIGLYQLTPDSTTTQLFYVLPTHWYKPWEKMAQVMNEAKYGGQMESALIKLKMIAERGDR